MIKEKELQPDETIQTTAGSIPELNITSELSTGESYDPNVTPETFSEAAQKDAIDVDDIKRANTILEDYMEAKKAFDLQVKENNSWFEMTRSKYEKQRDVANGGNPYSEENPSAWLFSTIANKHADFMDNIPTPAVQAREQSDEASAKLLSEVIPVIMEQNDFEEKYDNASWDKLKGSAACYMVLWDKYKNGLGDISIQDVDILNLFWQPNIKDIQKSKNLFYVEMVDYDTAKEMFPNIDVTATPETMKPEKYLEQKLDNSKHENEEVAIVNWYYKKFDPRQNRFILHYVKYINESLIYASENDPDYAVRGWYDHGLYPFIIDSLFYSATSPIGISIVDINKQTERDIEKLKRYVMENAQETRVARYFVKDADNDFNEEEFRNPEKRYIRVTGNVGDDRIKPIQAQALPSFVYNYLEFLIQELKETSNNKDVSTGSTGSGVTSGAAIAALQESGNKTSRDMLKGSYRVYAKICYLVIELIRQFYTEERCFRVVMANGATEYKYLSAMQLQPMNAAGIVREPIFDIEVTAQKSSPFSRVAQNEMAQSLYNAGAFSADRADESLIMLSMMDFEGKDLVVEKINTNKTMAQQNQELTQIIGALMQNPATAMIVRPLVQQMMANTPDVQEGTTQGIVKNDIEQSNKNQDNYETAMNGAMTMYKTPYANKLAEKTIVNTAKDNNDNNFTR